MYHYVRPFDPAYPDFIASIRGQFDRCKLWRHYSSAMEPRDNCGGMGASFCRATTATSSLTTLHLDQTLIVPAGVI